MNALKFAPTGTLYKAKKRDNYSNFQIYNAQKRFKSISKRALNRFFVFSMLSFRFIGAESSL